MRLIDLIEEIINLYPRFNRSWEGEYQTALGEHEGVALNNAWKAVMMGWTKSGAPKPADILKHIPRDDRASTPTPWHDDRQAGRDWADHVMTIGEGQEALREGFGRELWCWAEKHPDEIPGGRVVDYCRSEQEKFAARPTETIPTMLAPLVKMMNERETQLRQRFL